jgi:DNA polymerase III delta prime subunit
MLYFADSVNLRAALKMFAKKLFAVKAGSREQKMIDDESFSDLKVYPQIDKKLTVDNATDIIDDSALRPIEGDKKLYIISDFETAAPLFQNKLLKILEEPPAGVYFLLGATSLAPVLDTIKSRVKMLEIGEFTDDQIFCALERQGKNSLNGAVSHSCAGNLGLAQSMISGGWFEEVDKAADEICSAKTFKEAAQLSIKYGDSKYKNQLLCQMQRKYSVALQSAIAGKVTAHSVKCLIYAIESINDSIADVKFNANFSSLLYDLIIRIIQKDGE